MKRPFQKLALALLAAAFASPVLAADWPQWRGPNRDSLCTEKGLLPDWNARKPELLWTMKGLGKGFSTVSVLGDRIYTMGDRNGKQYILCIDATTQKELWATEVGGPWGDGTRCTPTVDDGMVYGLGTPDGDILAVDAETGKEVWRKSFRKDFGGDMMSGWGFSESHLIDGDRLICTPGARDAMIVALDKKTGQTIWKAAVPDLGSRGKDGAGYSSIVISEGGGVKQYIQLTGRGIVSVAAKDGKFLWNYNRIANGVANITTPVVKDDLVFVSTGYGTGSALLKLSADGAGGVKCAEQYFLDANTFQNHHGGIVLVGDYLYAGHGHNAGAPICVELKTGKVMWNAKALGRGSAAVLYADGNLIYRYENGPVALVAAKPDGFELKGTFEPAVKDGPSWPHPVIADGKLYLRAHDALMCYRVK